MIHNKYPAIKLIPNIIPNIIKPSFILVFFLNKNNRPRPAFIHKPDMHAPKLIPSSKYKLVITTLEAQFGIVPIIVANSGAKYLLDPKKLVNVSCPI